VFSHLKLTNVCTVKKVNGKKVLQTLVHMWLFKSCLFSIVFVLQQCRIFMNSEAWKMKTVPKVIIGVE